MRGAVSTAPRSERLNRSAPVVVESKISTRQLHLPIDIDFRRRLRPRRRYPSLAPRAFIRQEILPIPMPERQPSDLQVDVLRVLVRLGMQRTPVPPNQDLGKLVNHRCRQSVSKALFALEALGMIRVQYRQAQRRFYLPTLALMTGWGEHRMGHARRRGAPIFRPPPPPEPEKPAITGRPPLAIGQWAILGVEPARHRTLSALIDEERAPGPSRTCQWLGLMADETCSQKSLTGYSYCAHHKEICFRT